MTEIRAKIIQGEISYGGRVATLSAKLAYKKHEGSEVMITLLKGKRTEQQNKALHVYFGLLADALNEAGYTIQYTLKHKIDLDWSPDSVKELLWRPAQKAILKKKSTKALKKHSDIDKIYDHLNRHLGEKLGIHVPFPSHPPGYKDTAPLN